MGASLGILYFTGILWRPGCRLLAMLMLGKVYRAPNPGGVCTGNSGAGFKRDLIDAIDEEEIQARVRRVEKEKIRGRRDSKLNQFRVRWKRREIEGEEDECKWQMTNDVEQKVFSRRPTKDTLDASARHSPGLISPPSPLSPGLSRIFNEGDYSPCLTL